MTVAVAVLLAIAVLSALIGAFAVLRLVTPFEKLHAGTFVSLVAGVAIAVAGWCTEGFSGRPIKLVMIVVVLLLAGAAANHAMARALHYRDGERR